MFRLQRLTCNVEFCRRDLVLDFALVETFVFAADVRHTQLPLLAVLYTEIFRIVDVNRLQNKSEWFSIYFSFLKSISTMAALRCALQAIVRDSDMSRFIALRYYHSDIETQIFSIFNGNHFHYSCAALRVASDSER